MVKHRTTRRTRRNPKKKVSRRRKTTKGGVKQMKNFKSSLLSKNISQQEKILETMMNRAAKDLEEQPFYNWIQQVYTARIGTANDTDFARDALWSDMADHADSELFGELSEALL